MEAKAPTLLVLLIDVARLRWLVASIGLETTTGSGEEVTPLVASADGDLEPYLSLPLDEQVSFLRHRLSGVLQRGFDRIWARHKKPCQIVFVSSGLLDESAGPLTERLGEHFVQWLANPPVVFFVSEDGFNCAATPRLNKVAGEIEPPYEQVLEARLARLFQAANQPGLWELIPKKPYTKPNP